jgi:signal transduction histidine kinase
MIKDDKQDILTFVPKARIILQLGDQLIRSESIAILELIKNAYDACASKVTIRMKNVDNPRRGEIIIEDDGRGMDYNLIKDVWLQPGTTYKKNQLEDESFISPCNRIPLGEKGIGRFGVHKLGLEIELISKKRLKKEAHLNINWSDFDNDDLLDRIPIDLTEKSPEIFESGQTGTKIIIKNLRTKWTRGSIRELYRAINSLNSPFESLNSFKVHFKIDRKEWLDGLLTFSDIKESALFAAEATIKSNEVRSLTYQFTPWATMKKLHARTHQETNILMSHKVYDEVEEKKVMKEINLSTYKIGEVKLKVLIFDLDANILSLGVEDKKGLKDYLKSNGGVRVYRDKVRVYDYGEPGNDWLNLDIERVNLPTARISNNIIIGSIWIDRRGSTDLKEKTNREGFIENDAYREFLSAIRFTISRIVTQRNIDKDKLRSNYGSSTKVPVIDNLQILREKIGSTLNENDPAKAEILEIIKEIGDDYKTISEVYIRSASAGLSLTIVIHEIEKIISELIRVVEDSKSSERIKSLTLHLGKLIEGYSALIRRRSRKEYDLKPLIKQALWNIEFRLKAHEVVVVSEYGKEKDFPTFAKCSDSLILGIIVNVIDNSLWWLNYGKVQKKKIFIDISDELPGYLTLIIADNGPGFTITPEDAVKPFISNKEGGIGIGLHLAFEIMNSLGGELLFPSADQFTIPKEFKSGAIVALAFKKEKK